jgi:hypothetical protein
MALSPLHNFEFTDRSGAIVALVRGECSMCRKQLFVTEGPPDQRLCMPCYVVLQSTLFWEACELAASKSTANLLQ